MCGLFGGYSSVLFSGERDVIQNLMMVNFIRGEDSTGMFDYISDISKLGKSDTHWRYWKTTENPVDFARGKWKKAEADRWTKAQPSVIAGHARAATRGKVTQNNAHPFFHKPVIGMHNGTIYGPFKNHTAFETDSEALIRNIAEMGVKDAVEDLRNTHSAAYALVWINCKDFTLNMLRNDKRPLHLAREGKTGNTLFWSSESAQLHWALSYLKDSEKWEIEALPINKHYKWDLKSLSMEPEIEEVKLPVTHWAGYTGQTTTYPNYEAWTEEDWNTYQREYDRKQAEKAQQQIPWEQYPDEDAEEWPTRVVLGQSEDLTEPYIVQYSSMFKRDMYNHWDLVTQRWFTVWGWHRLNDLRRRRKEISAKDKPAESKPPVTVAPVPSGGSTELNDNLPDIMKPGYEPEEADEVKSSNFQWETAAPWHVNGDVVEYNDWLTATKNGCTWERCALVHDTEAIWVSKDYVLCEKHAREALQKGTELNYFFKDSASVIKNGLKGFKRRLLHEIALRTAVYKK